MMLDTSAYHGQSFGQQLGQPYGQSFGQQFAPFGQQLGQPFSQQFGQPLGQQFGQPYGQSLGQQIGQPFGQQVFGQAYGQPFGQQLGQPFGQQVFGQPYGQPFGQQFGQPYGQPFGQQVGQQVGQPYGQSFGPLSAVVPTLTVQSALGGFGAGGGWPGSLTGQSVPLPLALQSLCAHLAPLAARELGAGVSPGATQPGSFGGLVIGGWPTPFAGQLGSTFGQQQGYPIGQAIWGWPTHAAVPIGVGINPAAIALQGGQTAMGHPALVFGPRMIGGFGVPGASIAPVLAGAQPLAYAG